MRKRSPKLSPPVPPGAAPGRAALALVAQVPGAISELDPHSPLALYLASLSPSGRRTQAGNLERAALATGGHVAALQWELLRFGHVEIIRSKLQALGYSTQLINATLSALRGVARRCWHLGLMSAEDYYRIKDVRGVRGNARHRPARALLQAEIDLLLDACDRSGGAGGARDACLITLLYGGGLRRDEARRLQLSDYHERDHRLRVCGKGNRERTVFFDDPGARRAINNWLRVRGREQGPLLCAVTRSGALSLQMISGQAIYAALKRRGEQAGLAHFSPHDLRRSFATEQFNEGSDAALVQQLLGHASITTAQKYDLRSEKARRAASRRVRVSFRRPRSPKV